MQKTLITCLILALSGWSASAHQLQREFINSQEFFTLMITPKLFNFSSSVDGQLRYRPSLLGKPSLPKWMNFQFSFKRNLGYLYGSATEEYAGREIFIKIIALNKRTYETREIDLPIFIHYKPQPKNKIQMKITNHDWEQMQEKGNVDDLKEIFTELWPESRHDFSIIFMESAVKLGARLPLEPKHKEGVIIHIGSDADLSPRLLELIEEIKPLSKLSTCTFKRTKVQHLFQNADFKIDWCAFKVVTSEETSTSYPEQSTTENDMQLSPNKIWNGVRKDELPDRNYSEEIAVAVAIPSVLFASIIALLTIVLCFHHDNIYDEEYVMYIQDLFEICSRCSRSEKQSSEKPKLKEPVQMVQYSGTSKNPPTTALKSLHDPYSDNLSLDSDSPSTNIFQEGSPKLNAYYRPNPPAYTGKITFQGPSTSTVRFDKDI